MNKRPAAGSLEREEGFTLIEFIVASLIMTMVLGGTVTLALGLQRAFQTDMDNVAAEQEARYALDWIARDIRSAGSDPYDVVFPAQEITIDPNAGADNNDSIQLRSDAFPADGLLNAPGENVTIALDAANNVITRADAFAVDPTPIVMTDAIFTDLAFTFMNDAGNPEPDSVLVTSIRVSVTAQSRGRSAVGAAFASYTLSTDIRLRVR